MALNASGIPLQDTIEEGCNNTVAWDWVYAMLPAYMSAICILGVLGNALVLCVFCLQRDQCSVADIYLGNLAAADLLMLSCLPFWVATVADNHNWSFGAPMCKLVGIIIGMNYYCSVLFLTLVSLDRYLVLTRPMSVGRHRGATLAKGICAAIWAVGFSISLPGLLFRTVRYFPELGVDACFLDYPSGGWRLRHNVTTNLLGFLIPVTMVSYFSYGIVAVLNDNSNQVRRSSEMNMERKALLLVLLVLFAFILCWLPYQVVTFLDTLYYFRVISGCLWMNALDISLQLSTYLGYSNSTVNPFLYVIVGKQFRQKAKESFSKIVNCDKRDLSTSHINNLSGIYTDRSSNL